MEKYVLYTTHCPKCVILEKKLVSKGLAFEAFKDTGKMRELGISSVPVLEKPDGERLDYFSAVKFVNSL